jgi:hypothetical protein
MESFYIVSVVFALIIALIAYLVYYFWMNPEEDIPVPTSVSKTTNPALRRRYAS